LTTINYHSSDFDMKEQESSFKNKYSNEISISRTYNFVRY